MEKNKKVVVIGGGSGLSVLLRGLKLFPIDITAVVTVADDGSSTGALRKEFQIPAVGDLRKVLVSLSSVEPLMEELFQYRFKTTSDLDNHAIGNLILTALYDITGSLTDSLMALSSLLNIQGKVLPLTEDLPTLMARMTDGSIVEGESEITDAGKEIDRVYYKDKIRVIPEVIKAIEKADLIVMGMGSLYTSIMPNLIDNDVIEALKKAKAKKMYICNVMSQHGETDDYKVSDFIKAIEKHTYKGMLDVVLVNSLPISTDIQKRYWEELAKPVILDRENLDNIEVIEENLVVITNNQVRHDHLKVAFQVFAYLMRGNL